MCSCRFDASLTCPWRSGEVAWPTHGRGAAARAALARRRCGRRGLPFWRRPGARPEMAGRRGCGRCNGPGGPRRLALGQGAGTAATRRGPRAAEAVSRSICVRPTSPRQGIRFRLEAHREADLFRPFRPARRPCWPPFRPPASRPAVAGRHPESTSSQMHYVGEAWSARSWAGSWPCRAALACWQSRTMSLSASWPPRVLRGQRTVQSRCAAVLPPRRIWLTAARRPSSEAGRRAPAQFSWKSQRTTGLGGQHFYETQGFTVVGRRARYYRGPGGVRSTP